MGHLETLITLNLLSQPVGLFPLLQQYYLLAMVDGRLHIHVWLLIKHPGVVDDQFDAADEVVGVFPW